VFPNRLLRTRQFTESCTSVNSMGVGLELSEITAHPTSPPQRGKRLSLFRRRSSAALVAPDPDDNEGACNAQNDSDEGNTLESTAVVSTSSSGPRVKCPGSVGAGSEAFGILRSLLAACFSKRSTVDLLSVLADPGALFRLRAAHQLRYDDQLEAFEQLDLFVPASSGGANPRWACEAGIMMQGFLPRVALASLFARAVYGCVMQKGAEDGAFFGNAMAEQRGRFSARANLEAFLNSAGTQPEDILLSSWQERTFEPAFVVFWVREVRWLVVAIRGSMTWQSFLTDVAADTCQFAGGVAHSGMVRSAKWVLDQILPIVSAALANAADYTVVCTGHSLGANVAALLALFLRKNVDEGLPILSQPCAERVSETSSVSHGNVPIESPYPVAVRRAVAYCFGVSPLMSAELATRCAPFVLSVSRGFDIVTRMSAFTVDRLLLELTEASAPRKVGQWFRRKLGSLDGSPNSKVAVRDRAFGENVTVSEPLVPPGKLLHLGMSVGSIVSDPATRGKGCESSSHDSDVHLSCAMPGFYHQILINDQMFSDHGASKYVEDLLRAVRLGTPPLAAEGLHLSNHKDNECESEVLVRDTLQTMISLQEATFSFGCSSGSEI